MRMGNGPFSKNREKGATPIYLYAEAGKGVYTSPANQWTSPCGVSNAN